MEIVAPYPDLINFSDTLVKRYNFKDSDKWNGRNLQIPSEIGEGSIYLFVNGDFQFMKRKWKIKNPGQFSSQNQVEESDMVDFRVDANGGIQSSFLEGCKKYEFELNVADGFSFFMPKKLLQAKKTELIHKFQKYCYHPEVSKLIKELLSFTPNCYTDCLKLEWKFLELSYHYLEFINHQDISHHFGELPTQHVKAIRNAQNFLDTHFNQDISIQELSKMVGLNIQYLKKGFKRLTEYSIRQYLIKVRMEKSYKMVMFSDTPINEISYKVGYANPSFFIRLYKKCHGMTPLQHRISGDKSFENTQ